MPRGFLIICLHETTYFMPKLGDLKKLYNFGIPRKFKSFVYAYVPVFIGTFELGSIQFMVVLK